MAMKGSSQSPKILYFSHSILNFSLYHQDCFCGIFGRSSSSLSCAISRFFVRIHLAFFIFSGMKSLFIEYLFDFVHRLFVLESEFDLDPSGGLLVLDTVDLDRIEIGSPACDDQRLEVILFDDIECQ